MAYLVLVICITYSLLWAAGLAFAVRSDGQKAIWVPALGLVLFIAGSASSAMSVQQATANPPKLTEESYTALTVGMTLEDAEGILGTAQPDEKEFDLNKFSLTVPNEVSSRLRGAKHAAARDAQLVISFSGEPSRANLRRGEGLGLAATEEANGIMGLEVAIRENGNELKIVEGEHWNYEDDMTPEQIAEKFAELIDAEDAWNAEVNEDKPKQVVITPELEANKASACNEACTAQVLTGANTSVKIRGADDGSEMKFSGGEDEAFVKFWFEEGVLMDADFSTSDKLVIGGFIAGKMVGKTQSGIDIPAPPAEEEDGGEG